MLDRLTESVAAGTADWSIVGSAFTRTNAKLYLRFTEVEKGRKKFNVPAGGGAFGSTPPPALLYTGPTDRPIIRKMLAAGEPVTATPERVAPGESNTDHDVIGPANVQRGTRRCTLADHLIELQLLHSAIATSVAFTAAEFEGCAPG